MLALHQVLVLAEIQLQVNTAVRARSTTLDHPVALLAERLRHQAFELRPAQLGHLRRGRVCGHSRKGSLLAPASKERHASPQKQDDRNQVLQERRELTSEVSENER